MDLVERIRYLYKQVKCQVNISENSIKFNKLYHCQPFLNYSGERIFLGGEYFPPEAENFHPLTSGRLEMPLF